MGKFVNSSRWETTGDEDCLLRNFEACSECRLKPSEIVTYKKSSRLSQVEVAQFEIPKLVRSCHSFRLHLGWASSGRTQFALFTYFALINKSAMSFIRLQRFTFRQQRSKRLSACWKKRVEVTSCQGWTFLYATTRQNVEGKCQRPKTRGFLERFRFHPRAEHWACNYTCPVSRNILKDHREGLRHEQVLRPEANRNSSDWHSCAQEFRSIKSTRCLSGQLRAEQMGQHNDFLIARAGDEGKLYSERIWRQKTATGDLSSLVSLHQAP